MATELYNLIDNLQSISKRQDTEIQAAFAEIKKWADNNPSNRLEAVELALNCIENCTNRRNDMAKEEQKDIQLAMYELDGFVVPE